jgi:hypothetical protein
MRRDYRPLPPWVDLPPGTDGCPECEEIGGMCRDCEESAMEDQAEARAEARRDA